MIYDNLLEFEADLKNSSITDDEIIEKLPAPSEDIQKPLGFGVIGLIWAVKANRSGLLNELLLKYNFDIGETTMDGKTAAQLASELCHWDCVYAIAAYFVTNPQQNTHDKGRLNYALYKAKQTKQPLELITTLNNAVNATLEGVGKGKAPVEGAPIAEIPELQASDVGGWRKQPVSGSSGTVASQIGFTAQSPLPSSGSGSLASDKSALRNCRGGP
jgi:hypothetical protein